MRAGEGVALVTGGGGGIGRAIARTLSDAGYVVVAGDIQSPPGPLRDSTAGRNGIRDVQLDVCDEDVVRGLVGDIEGSLGPIRLLVNCAGILSVAPILDLDAKVFDRHFRVNTLGAFICSKAVAIEMRRRRAGSIINIASIAGKEGRPLFAAYAASKAALLNLTQSFALALADADIRVNAVCPGIVDTDMWRALDQELARLQGKAVGEPFAERVASIPLGRAESVKDVADLVRFLASPEAAYITGQSINVDGGLMLH